MAEQKRFLSPLALILLLSGIFFAVFLVISGLMYLSTSPDRLRGGSSAFFSGEAIGVVEVNGVILDSKKTLTKLEKLEENDQIKAVVLRLNSPGGAVAPSQEIYEAVKNYKKPLVVSMGSVAASGAFYIACGAKKVFANPGTLTGSIGVIMEFANLEKLYAWAKVERYAVKTGRFKDIGAEYRQMTAQERAILQTMIDDVLFQFKSAVALGRNLSMEQVTAVADGRIFSGSQAKAAHLVDELGTIRDAIREAGKMAKIKGKPTVVYIERQKRGLFDLLFEDPQPSEGSDSVLQPGTGASLVGQFSRLFGALVRESSGEGSGDHLGSFVPGLYWVWGGASLR